jgi:NADH dehydrogenase
MLLLVGGTGLLGRRVARRLAARRGELRAIVRPNTDGSALVALGFDVEIGDVRDPASLDEALAGIDTVVSTCTAMSRALEGDGSVSIADVDDEGNANLVDAAIRAGVARFVFVSEDRAELESGTPLTDAKVATERRLRVAPFASVVVRAAPFREAWLSPQAGFDPAHGTVRIWGGGHTPIPWVAADDVAEAVARLATMPDPPPEIDLAGPEAVSVEALVERWTKLTGRDVAITRVPRPALAIGSWVVRAVHPALASSMGMALEVDGRAPAAGGDGFRTLGIEPSPVSEYLRQLAGPAVPA